MDPHESSPDPSFHLIQFGIEGQLLFPCHRHHFSLLTVKILYFILVKPVYAVPILKDKLLLPHLLQLSAHTRKHTGKPVRIHRLYKIINCLHTVPLKHKIPKTSHKHDLDSCVKFPDLLRCPDSVNPFHLHIQKQKVNLTRMFLQPTDRRLSP